VYDANSVEEIQELQQLVLDLGATGQPTQCAHIFPESTHQNIVAGKVGQVTTKVRLTPHFFACPR